MYHILLVEDEKLVRDFITEYFNIIGFIVYYKSLKVFISKGNQ